MKKIIALTLSLLMVFTLIPMTITASADEGTYTKVLDFDTILTDAVPVSTNSSNVSGGVINYSEIDTNYTDGNVIKMAGKQWQNYGFYIGDVLKDKRVKSISYTIWSDAAGTINTNGRTGISDNVSTIKLTARTHLGLTSHISTSTTPKTVTYDLSALAPSTYNTINNATLVFCNDSANTVVYIDNIVITYQKYAGTFTGSIDGDKVIYADEDGKLTTPTATISEGEFAGWVTEADADTIIPANTEITLTEDTTYFAVSKTREPQEAPEAPVVASKTSDSVTLVATDGYQYSKDGITWQDSNVFSGLAGGTEYTFYQRLKATPTKFASPASESTTVATNIAYKWNIYSTNFTKNSGATLKGGFDTTLKNDGTYFVSTGNAVGATATLTSLSTVKSGVYSVKLYARAAGARANIDVSINNNVLAEGLNTGKTSTINSLDYGFQLSDVKILAEDQPITLTITTTTSGSLYLNSLELTKIAEVEKDGETTDAVLTDDKASIRLTNEGGIRFFTTFDASKVTGTVEEIGTLIGPKDLVGDYLTIEDTYIPEGAEAGNAIAVPYLSSVLWKNNQFVGSIVNIKTTNYTRDFVARGYVKVDGVYYYSTNTATRNVRFVADAYIADENSDYATLDEATKAIVDKFATPKAE